MRRDGLQLVACLVALALVTQGVSTATKRLWMPAHYHLPAGATTAQPARAHAGTASNVAVVPGHGHAHGADAHRPAQDHRIDRHRLAETMVRHPWRGHGFVLRDQEPVRVQSHHRHGDSRPAHSHAAIGHHSHDRGATGVVYVDEADEGAPPATVPRGEADHFWGDLPSSPSLALKPRRGDPPPPPAPMRLDLAGEAPLRPPC